MMLRTILTVDQNNLTLSLPDDFVGKTIEVIAFPLEEAIPNKNKKSSFKALQLDTRGYQFDRDEANER